MKWTLGARLRINPTIKPVRTISTVPQEHAWTTESAWCPALGPMIVLDDPRNARVVHSRCSWPTGMACQQIDCPQSRWQMGSPSSAVAWMRTAVRAALEDGWGPCIPGGVVHCPDGERCYADGYFIEVADNAGSNYWTSRLQPEAVVHVEEVVQPKSAHLRRDHAEPPDSSVPSRPRFRSRGSPCDADVECQWMVRSRRFLRATVSNGQPGPSCVEGARCETSYHKVVAWVHHEPRGAKCAVENPHLTLCFQLSVLELWGPGTNHRRGTTVKALDALGPYLVVVEPGDDRLSAPGMANERR